MQPVSSCWPHLLFCTVGLALVGCTTIQPVIKPVTDSAAAHQEHLASLANIRQFRLQGRIGAQTDGKGFSGIAHWQHDSTGNNVALFSPLGDQVATIKTTASGAELITSDGKSFNAKDAETLTQKALGWSLPMTGLSDWVLGRPATSLAEYTEWDTDGRITKLTQDGWKIEYPQYTEIDGYQLPKKVNLHSPKLNLKLVIEEWSELTDQEATMQKDQP